MLKITLDNNKQENNYLGSWNYTPEIVMRKFLII